jgi:hypothetical protein
VVGLNGKRVKSEKDLFAALDNCRCARTGVLTQVKPAGGWAGGKAQPPPPPPPALAESGPPSAAVPQAAAAPPPAAPRARAAA